jgi:hypothetical protein
VGFSGAYGLDFSALIAMAPSYGVSPDFLSRILPAVESGIINAMRSRDGPKP